MERMPLSYTDPGVGERPAPYDPADVDARECSIIGQALNAHMGEQLRRDTTMMAWKEVEAMNPDQRRELRASMDEAQERLYRVVCKWTPDPLPLATYRRLSGWTVPGPTGATREGN